MIRHDRPIVWSSYIPVMTEDQTVRPEIHVDGTGDETMVMVHGWPDTWRLWDKQVEAFSAHWRCVRFTLPGFDRATSRRAYSIDELVACIGRVADHVSPTRPVILMIHDWGCAFGFEYAMRHPDRVARIVAIDVGDYQSPEYRRSLSFKAIAMIWSYQRWLDLAWRIGGWWGDRMTLRMAQILGCRADPKTIHSGMNYPYHIQWSRRLGGYRGLHPVDPRCPLFYAWAERKPVMFQSPQWLKAMAARPGNVVRRYDCGHWVMRSRAEAFNDDVRAWLDTAGSRVRRSEP